MSKYSNRRRSHIHFIRQYCIKSNEYTGTRVVIFIKGKKKYIYDMENFKIHRYENPKNKKPNKSTWNIVCCSIDKIIKKQMVNFSQDGKLKMYHILYESLELELIEYYLKVFKEENIPPIKIYLS
ncbi:hypothetical protein BD780_000609 [Clostridium tetanomorphum]|uniref:Uncharacterized protein n=1 Tax=Clostridium tetanomorphum TaxID=1553 RepID=A0A923E724_CLOTT|nr:hypothetical protein [Clostridium tetanomorphum]KAJ51784.1 hypothetical protein CTM_10968 [Clostridium tetanomorphum DSM 665]MBC2397665.1 hypothetical protein [Clostridium tetanomorphum]MBP1865019.1 hypothetical protein [Clostridium tetanomorphum]NRS83384.1 hypothetical protein [Clostridium tetanomorphum]NRZ96583.1 hypothetical protein [Clostridium tetanomorphum]